MRQTLKIAGSVSLLLIGSLLLAGCGGGEAPAAEEGPQTFTVRGQFVAPALDGEAMRVSHEEMPGYMDAMTMNFLLQDPAEIAEIKPGDKIEFTYVADGTDAYAHSIKMLPPETELTLR